METNVRPLSLKEQIFASASGSLVTSVFMTPFDVVKTRLQVQQKPIVAGECFLYCNGLMDHTCAAFSNGAESLWYKQRQLVLNGTIDAFRKIIRFEGVTSLWSGLSPTLVMAVPATIIYFTLYDRLKYIYGFRENDPTTVHLASLAGATGRVAAVSVISPLELIRTKLQSQKLSYRQAVQAVSVTVANSGYVGLYRGLSVTLLRDVPFSCIYWYGYELLKQQTYPYFNSTPSQPKFAQAFICGALSGTAAAVVTLPLDVIKTHRQIELGEIELLNRPKQLNSSWQLLRELFHQKGLTGMFAGVVPRVAKVAPACAIMISSFELSKSFFRKKFR